MGRRKRKAATAICPSARAEPGATLVGMIGVDGRVAYLKTAIAVDREFIDEISAEGPPEERFRFANACVEGRCVQWKGTRCGVLDDVKPVLGDGAGHQSLQPCAIRGACRWFLQDGPPSCRICPGVITDVT